MTFNHPLSQANYVNQQGLAGAFVWSVELDDFSADHCSEGRYPLITAIMTILRGGRARTAAAPLPLLPMYPSGGGYEASQHPVVAATSYSEDPLQQLARYKRLSRVIPRYPVYIRAMI